MLALLLVAASIGLDNFAVAVGFGSAGVTNQIRLRVGLVFGVFEAGMPIVGLLLGHRLADSLGHTAQWVGAGLLIATGVYGIVIDLLDLDTHRRSPRVGIGQLIITGLALSIDNLVIGFALGTYHADVLLAAVVIGVVSVGLSLVGLELGARIGKRAPARVELLGSATLIAVGLAIGFGIL